MDSKTFEKTIKNFEKRIEKLETAVFHSNTTIKKKSKHTGLAGAIYELKQESFFDTPKNLSVIIEKVKARGTFYPKTSYPDALLRLVRKKELRRIKEDGSWMYVKNG